MTDRTSYSRSPAGAQKAASLVRSTELRPGSGTGYRRARLSGSRRATDGFEHLDNDIVVEKVAENTDRRTPSIRLRDTETWVVPQSVDPGHDAAPLRSASGILKHEPVEVD